MYEQTHVQSLIVFENYCLLTDGLREFDPDDTLIHCE